MLSLFRKKIVKNQFLLIPITGAGDRIVTGYSTHIPLNISNSTRNQLQLRRTKLPNLHGRFYSTDSEKPQNENEDASKVQRSIPRIVNDKIQIGPPFLGFITTRVKALQIRNSIDSEFNLNEFVEGSKKAAEVVSDKLASADFDGLQGLVKDEIIESLREPILSMTEAQRSELRVHYDDIVKQFVSTIDITAARGSAFVDILMVYHVVKDFKRITNANEITPAEFFKQPSKFLAENFFILNYKFTKEFSKGLNDDWIVSYINHVNISDEMMEQTKGIEIMLKEKREMFEKERKQKK